MRDPEKLLHRNSLTLCLQRWYKLEKTISKDTRLVAEQWRLLSNIMISSRVVVVVTFLFC